jgi:DNA-binding XRE family transcriptional regulator
LTYEPGTSIEALPSAALVDLFERGDLSDWQPVLAAIARDSKGALARRVMELMDRFPMYGTAPLIRAWIDRVRAASRWVEQPAETAELRDLRRRMGLTQTELAARLDMSQSDLSKLERRKDVRLSTLESYVEGLGGHLMVVASLPEAVVRVRLAKEPSGSRSATGS